LDDHGEQGAHQDSQQGILAHVDQCLDEGFVGSQGDEGLGHDAHPQKKEAKTEEALS
jgi:hypothetical protein